MDNAGAAPWAGACFVAHFAAEPNLIHLHHAGGSALDPLVMSLSNTDQPFRCLTPPGTGV